MLSLIHVVLGVVWVWLSNSGNRLHDVGACCELVSTYVVKINFKKQFTFLFGYFALIQHLALHVSPRCQQEGGGLLNDFIS